MRPIIGIGEVEPAAGPGAQRPHGRCPAGERHSTGQHGLPGRLSQDQTAAMPAGADNPGASAWS